MDDHFAFIPPTFQAEESAYTLPTAAAAAGAEQAAPGQPKTVSNLLGEMMQSGRRFEPKDIIDFSSLTLPNSHKANKANKRMLKMTTQICENFF